jgi:hypothetical protein
MPTLNLSVPQNFAHHPNFNCFLLRHILYRILSLAFADSHKHDKLSSSGILDIAIKAGTECRIQAFHSIHFAGFTCYRIISQEKFYTF